MSGMVERLSDRVIPAVPVPFGGGGAIDDELQDLYVAWMARQSVGGVTVWAHTGRGMLLSDEQREHVARAWRGGIGDAPLICGVGVPDAEELPADAAARTNAALRAAGRMAALAVQCGADALLAHPPRALAHLRDPEARVMEYHRAICAAGVPVIAFYLYDAAGGVAYTADLVVRLLELDGVIGIKVATLDSVMTYQDILAAVAQVPGALPITGEDRFLGYSLIAGARSALIGLGAAVTDCSSALLEARAQERWGRFHELTGLLDEFARATFVVPMEGYIQRMLWALEADGVLPRVASDPWSPPLPPGERERVFAAVRTLRSR